MNTLLPKYADCSNYTQSQCTSFASYSFSTEENFHFQFKKQSAFLFMLQGKMTLLSDNQESQVEAGQMYALPYNSEYTVKARERSQFILWTFEHPEIQCNKLSFNTLKKSLIKNSISDNSLQSLPILPPISNFLKEIIFYIKNAEFCHHLMDIKRNEWFFLMHTFYTKEENTLFFTSLMQSEENFVTLVKEKVKNVSSVKELAAACYMTPKTFTRKFKAHFNTTPKQWMILLKKQQIKKELIQGNKSIKEISDKFGFTSSSHLSCFTKKQFNATPTQLRKNANS